MPFCVRCGGWSPASAGTCMACGGTLTAERPTRRPIPADPRTISEPLTDRQCKHLYELWIAHLERAGQPPEELATARAALEEIDLRLMAAGAREAGMSEAAWRRKLDVDEALIRWEWPEPWSTVAGGAAGVVVAVITGVVLVVVRRSPVAALLGTVGGVLVGVTVAVVVPLGLEQSVERMARRSRISMGTFEGALGILWLALLALLLLLPAVLVVALTQVLATMTRGSRYRDHDAPRAR